MERDEHPFRVAAAPQDGHGGPVLVVSVEGELDVAVAGELSAELAEERWADYPAVVIDLAALTFLDSAGLHSLLLGTEALTAAGRPHAIVVQPSSPINSILGLTGLAERLPLHSDREEALRAVKPSSR